MSLAFVPPVEVKIVPDPEIPVHPWLDLPEQDHFAAFDSLSRCHGWAVKSLTPVPEFEEDFPDAEAPSRRDEITACYGRAAAKAKYKTLKQ